MVVVDSFTSKNRDRRILENIEAGLVRLQSKSFNTEPDVTTEEILYIGAATPRMVASDVSVVGTKHWIALAGTLDDVHERRIRSELGIGESVRSPETHVPFTIAVPLRTRRRRSLLHFFPEIFSRVTAGVGYVRVITETRGNRRFGFRAFAAEQPGERNEQINNRRIVRDAKQRGDVEPSLRTRFPRDGWADGETVHGIAACVLRCDIPVFHFYSDLQILVTEQNRRYSSLGKTPFTPPVAGVLFFEEPVHGPFDAFEKILCEKQTQFIRIGNFGRTALFLFFSASRRWRNFFMSDGADAELILGEQRRIERNLVPISQSPSCFQTHGLRTAATVEAFEPCFGRYVETVRQTHFDLLSEKVIGWPVAERLAFVKLAKEERPWRQNVGVHYIRKTAARNSRGRTVRAGHFLGGDDNRLFFSYRLAES